MWWFRDLQKSAHFFSLRPVFQFSFIRLRSKLGMEYRTPWWNAWNIISELIRTMSWGIPVPLAKSIDWINTSEGKCENANAGIATSLTFLPTWLFKSGNLEISYRISFQELWKLARLGVLSFCTAPFRPAWWGSRCRQHRLIRYIKYWSRGLKFPVQNGMHFNGFLLKKRSFRGHYIFNLVP